MGNCFSIYEKIKNARQNKPLMKEKKIIELNLKKIKTLRDVQEDRLKDYDNHSDLERTKALNFKNKNKPKLSKTCIKQSLTYDKMVQLSTSEIIKLNTIENQLHLSFGNKVNQIALKEIVDSTHLLLPMNESQLEDMEIVTDKINDNEYNVQDIVQRVQECNNNIQDQTTPLDEDDDEIDEMYNNLGKSQSEQQLELDSTKKQLDNVVTNTNNTNNNSNNSNIILEKDHEIPKKNDNDEQKYIQMAESSLSHKKKKEGEILIST